MAKKTPPIPNDLKAVYNVMMEAESALIDFVAEHQEIIDAYEQLRRDHLDKMEEVKRVYAKHVDTVGNHFFGFRASTAREVDADSFMKIADAHGIDPFPYMTHRVVLKKLDEGVASGELPKDVLDAVGLSSPRISLPRR